MSNANSNQQNLQVTNASTTTFSTALWLNGAVFAGELVLFTLVRRRFKAIYEPRTYIPPEGKRMTPLPPTLLSWPIAVLQADYHQVLHQNGMDAYVFLRFLRLMVKIFLPIWFLSWAVLLPVDSVNSTGDQKGLNQFTIGNVLDNRRLSAHIVLAWLFTGYILYNLQTEMRHFIYARQQFLVSPAHAATAQANTVLITGIPLRYLNEISLTRLFNCLPGGVAKVWINRNLKELPELYDARLKACDKLEGAEIKLLKTALKLRNARNGPDCDKPEGVQEAGGRGWADDLVPRNRRPTHRLPIAFLPFSLPFLGKKVDTIDWAQDEISRTSQLLDKGRDILENEDTMKTAHSPSIRKRPKYPPLNSAFILFRTQISAHIAAQCLAHHAPYRMGDKYTEVAPADVIWDNLGMNPYEMKVRTALSYAATFALVIFWAVPVSAIGGISASAANCDQSWLAWICTLPDTVKGLIQGVLPPILLALLNMLLPIVLRLLARFEGIPRKTGVELSLMTRFFIFQVVHNFIVLTLASSLADTASKLANDPSSVSDVLGSNLPNGSTFFMTYVILQGLSGSAAGFLQVIPLFVYYAKLFILGSTPRSIYSIKYDLRDVAWGTLFPSITLITVISIAYMIISPIMCGLACVAFSLFYIMWKYLFLWQLEQPASGDTGGQFFPKALQHTMVGLYLQQICLTILLFLKKMYPGGIVMIVLLILTGFFHLIFNNSFDPLIHPLPLTFASRSFGAIAEGEGEADEEGFGGDEITETRREKKKGGEEAILLEKKKETSGGGAAGPVVGDAGKGSENAYGAFVGTEGKRNDGPTDFNHPASVEPQRIIWIPRDTLGLGEAEVARLKEFGVEAGTENASMDDRGHTDIDGPPPGMTGPVDP